MQLIIFALFAISSTLGLTGDKCEDLAPADCKPQDVCNTAGTLQGNDAATCQLFCDLMQDTQCNMFNFDAKQQTCTLFSCRVNEYERTCLIKSGLKTQIISECSLDGPDTCASFRKSECIYKGQVINTFSGVRETEACWAFCNAISGCHSYEHELDNEECVLHSHGEIECSHYIGPRSPAIGGCQLTTTTISTTTTPQSTTTTTTAYISTSDPLMTLSVRTLDATTNLPIAGAYISFETMTTPEIEGEGETDQSGILNLGQFRVGQVLEVTALAEGYYDLEKNFTVQYNPSLQETLTMALSPEAIFNETRIVMSWNPEPSDLDLHTLQIDRSTGNIICHCYYGSKICQGMNLDVDNTQGGDAGAETITISEAGDYLYAIYVFDFNPNPSFPLSQSGANIDVYGLAEGFLQFSVPTEEPIIGTKCRYWLIGCLDGRGSFATNGTLFPGASESELSKICF